MNQSEQGAWLPTEEEIRAGFELTADSTSQAAACPAAEEIWRSARGAAQPEQIMAAVLHVASCPACAEAWRLARELSPQTGARVVASPVAGWSPGRQARMALLAAAASLVLVSGLALYLLPGVGKGPAVERAGRGETIRSLLAADQPIRRDTCLLQWEADVQVESWSVEIGAEDLSHIASAEGLRSSEYLVPRQSLEKVAAGSCILWRVEGRLPGGRKIASLTFRARIQ